MSYFFTFLVGLVLIGLSPVFAGDEESRLSPVFVRGEKIVVPTKQTDEAVYTGQEITTKGIQLSGEKGKSSIYEVISILPGIVFEGIDPSNLATEQANIRIRGVRGYLGSMTVEGVPNYGGNPIGPRAYIYDTENFEGIAVYKGAVPADLGSSMGNRSGAIELHPLWAEKDFGLKASESMGMFDYKRSYVRLNSGSVGGAGTRFSLSYSYAAQKKWKGPGEIGPRDNFNFTFVQPIRKDFEIKVWGNLNEIEHNKYRYLTYGQLTDLGKNYRLDFNERLTAPLHLYYEFNKEYHKNRDLLVSIKGSIGENIKISLKPYRSKEDANIWDGSQGITFNKQTKPGAIKRIRDIEREGILADISCDLGVLKTSGGYHHESSDMNIYDENYWINPNGSLTYLGYGVFATSGTTHISSPYIKFAGTLDRLNWQAGIKYFEFKDSDTQGYRTVPDVNGNPVIQPAPYLDRKGETYKIWLPTTGVSYKFDESSELYLSYGRNYIRPYAYMPILRTYNRLYNEFVKQGITLNELFKNRSIEQSDYIDIGLRFRKEIIELSPTVFLSRHKNLLTVVTDPRVIDPQTNSPVNYQLNIGKANGYGLELGTNIFISDWLSFYVNPTFSKLTYDGNISFSGKELPTDGKQVVDVPKWIVGSGLIVKLGDFEIVPSMRFVGKRYGDSDHDEAISSYSVFDLKLNYHKDKWAFFKSVSVSLEVDNIFNKKYVSIINAMDDAVSGTTYGVGSPFFINGRITFTF